MHSTRRDGTLTYKLPSHFHRISSNYATGPHLMQRVKKNQFRLKFDVQTRRKSITLLIFPGLGENTVNIKDMM